MKLQSGHELEPLSDLEMKLIHKDFEGFQEGLVRLTPGRWLLPSGFKHIADKIYNFQYKKSDVVIMVWPKCGTTWTQEVIWNMRNNPNLETDAASPLTKSMLLEQDMLTSTPNLKDEGILPFKNTPKTRLSKDPTNGVFLQMTENLPKPRTFKTHLSFSLMNPSMLDTCKVVYVARNPKDVLLSYNHHSRLLEARGYVGSFGDFVKYFVDDNLMYAPYWLHVKEAWEKRNHPNLLFLFYEDMKADPLKEMKKIDAFVGTRLTEEQMKGIIKYTSFEEMKARDNPPAANFRSDVLRNDGGFFRKGESGEWKSKLTPDLEAKVDEWIRKHLDPLGISFKYEI